MGHYSARMVTNGRWKLVWNMTDLSELYDLEHDPGELSNRFYDTTYRDVRERYISMLVNEGDRLEDGHHSLLSAQLEDRLAEALDDPMNTVLERVRGQR